MDIQEKVLQLSGNPNIIRNNSLPISPRGSLKETLAGLSEYASLCVQDAFQGRLSNGLATNSKKSKLIYTIFWIQTSDFFLNLVVYSSIVHTLLVFLETELLPRYIYQLIHLLIFLLQFSDFAMKIFYQGWNDYFKTGWHFIYTGTIILHFFDLCFNSQTLFTDPLRPVVGLLRSRSGRRFFSVVQKMIPTFSQSLAPLIGFMLIVTFAYFSLFRVEDGFMTMLNVAYNWIWLVLTNDSFYRLYFDGSSALHSLFFFTALYVGQRFIMSIFLAATFDTFGKFTKKQVKTEKLKELQGLVKAFSVLDLEKEGSITYSTWYMLLHHLDPTYTNEQIALYFEIISEGKDCISLLQFLELKNVLGFTFKRCSEDSMINASIFLKKIADKYLPSLRVGINIDCDRAQKILNFMAEYRIPESFNFLDILVLTSETLQNDYHLVFLVNVVYLFEFYCHISVSKGNLVIPIFTAESWFTRISSLGVLGILLQDLFPGASSSSVRSSFIFMRTCRLFHLNKELVIFLKAVIDVVPLFSKLMIFAFIIAYIFAMFGHLLFRSYVPEWSSPLLSMVVIQKLFLPVDLLVTMESVMSKVHPAFILFFFANFLLSLIICNLSLSIVIDWYSDSLNNFNALVERESAYDNVFKAIYSRVRGRDRDGLNYEVLKDYVMVKHEQGDHRSKFIQGEDSFNIKDLKQCQKYSSIDLLSLYNREKKKSKELDWEQTFVSKIKEVNHTKMTLNMKDLIYKEGDKADKCYILVSGIASCFVDDKKLNLKKYIDIPAVSVLGGDTFFQSDGFYKETCVAAIDSVECIVLTKAVIFEDLDPYQLGTIMKLSQKTVSAVQSKFTSS